VNKIRALCSFSQLLFNLLMLLTDKLQIYQLRTSITIYWNSGFWRPWIPASWRARLSETYNQLPARIFRKRKAQSYSGSGSIYRNAEWIPSFCLLLIVYNSNCPDLPHSTWNTGDSGTPERLRSTWISKHFTELNPRHFLANTINYLFITLVACVTLGSLPLLPWKHRHIPHLGNTMVDI